MESVPYVALATERVRADAYDGGERLTVNLSVTDFKPSQAKRRVAAWCGALPTFSNVRWLNVWSHVTQPSFDAICEMTQLECLMIKWGNIRNLDAIENLQRLKYLYIGSSTRVESIAPLSALQDLKVLHLENFKRIADFSPLVSLKTLEVLDLPGSMWGRQDVGPLEPFSQMTWLRSLSLDTTRVTSLRPLASLVQLEELGLGGRLPLEEYAWLAAKLRNTRCDRFMPHVEVSDWGLQNCATCGGSARVLLTGKGGSLACPKCDERKIAKWTDRYEHAFRAAQNDDHA